MRPRKAGWLAVKEIQERRPGCRRQHTSRINHWEVSSDDCRHAYLAVGRVCCEMEDLQCCHSSVSRQKTQKWDVTVENGFIRIGVRTTYDDSESALSRVSAQPVEILLCHNCHRSFHEPSVQMELDLDAYPICRVVVTNVTVQPWAFHRKFSTNQSFQ